MSKAKHEKLFPPLVRAVVQAAQEIFDKDQYADRVIERTLKADRRRGSRDRAFIAENVYEIVRHYRLLYAIDGKPPTQESDWWRLFGIRWLLAGHSLPAWREFKGLDPAQIRERYIKLTGTRKLRESVPDWLDERGETELGDATWTQTLGALNQPASVVLRPNTLRTDITTLQRKLQEAGIETKKLHEKALLVTRRRNLFTTEAFQQGWFEVQDWSSQQVAPFLEIEPGQRIIDACAGAGGKTLHLASLLDNKGRIISLDTEEWKLKELRKRASRNGVDIVETRPIENTKVIKRLYDSADRLLLDVPCSGLGVIRRNPDAKWKLSAEFIDRIRSVQQDILQQYPRMVKSGGKMVYATCSILPSENRAQVDAFLASEAGQDWTLEEDRAILPQDEGFDGFYMARLVKA